MNMSRRTILSGLAVMLVLPAAACQALPSARSILENVIKAQDQVKTMRLRQTITTATPFGPGLMEIEVALRKPDKFYVETRLAGAAKPLSITVCDGKRMWSYSGMANQYYVGPKPKDIEKMIASIGHGKGAMDRAAKTAKLVGTDKIRGISTYVVKVDQPGGDNTKFWIGRKDYQLYRVVMDRTAKKNPKAGAMGPGTSTTTFEALSIQINKPIPSSTFTFVKPKGAVESKKPINFGFGSRMPVPMKGTR